MGKYIVIAIFVLALAAKGVELLATLQLAIAHNKRKKEYYKKNSNKKDYKKSYTNSGSRAAAASSFSSSFKSAPSSKAERGTPSGSSDSFPFFEGGSKNGNVDFSNINDTAHSEAIRMHQEAESLHRTAHENAVQMSDFTFANDVSFANDIAWADHDFGASTAFADSITMQDIAVNDSSFLNDMATSSFDMGFGGGFDCGGGFGMF